MKKLALSKILDCLKKSGLSEIEAVCLVVELLEEESNDYIAVCKFAEKIKENIEQNI